MPAALDALRDVSGVPHSCPKRPESGRWSYAGTGIATPRNPWRKAASRVIRRWGSFPPVLLAMQKVVGSSPIIRSR